MITGSHNPSEFNGFKTVCGASTIHGEAIQEIRRMIEQRRFRRPAQARRRRPMWSRPTWTRSRAQFHFPRRIKVVFDAGNGTGGPVMHRILDNLNVRCHRDVLRDGRRASRITIPIRPCRRTSRR